jgi:hypothetical protein
MNHLVPEQRYRTLTGSLIPPTSVIDGNTLARQVNPNSTPEASLPGQTTQYGFPVSHDPWNDRVTGPAPVSSIEDQRRSPQTISSVNTGIPSSGPTGEPTASKQSMGDRPVRPPVPLFALDPVASHPYSGATTALAPSDQESSDERHAPNPRSRRPGKGEARKRDV